MQIYDCAVRITIPENLRDVANKIAKSFDPDTGGDKTFDTEVIDGYISVNVPCVKELADSFMYFNVMPEMLYDSVLRDYQTRWSDLEAPTLEECKEFCKFVLIE